MAKKEGKGGKVLTDKEKLDLITKGKKPSKSKKATKK